jgi:hypothetical protein
MSVSVFVYIYILVFITFFSSLFKEKKKLLIKSEKLRVHLYQLPFVFVEEKNNWIHFDQKKKNLHKKLIILLIMKQSDGKSK